MPIDGNINGWAVRHVLFSQRLGTLALQYPSNGYTFYEAVLGGEDSRIHKLKEVSTEYLLANEVGTY